MSTTGTKCPVTRRTFKASAKRITLSLADGQMVSLEPREFSTVNKDTGLTSFGYYANGKLTVTIEGQQVTLQVGVNATVCKSNTQAE